MESGHPHPHSVGRALVFRNLDEVVREAEMLHLRGYDRLGQWNLAQVCGHLAEWMSFPVRGYPPVSLPMRVILWVLRQTVGRRAIRKVLASGTMPRGGQTLKQTVPPPDLDEAEALGRLREAVHRFQAHEGPMHPSPLFGELSGESLTRLQLIHCAHHLGMLKPKA